MLSNCTFDRRLPAMPRITISYRRDDSLDITGRIFDRLAGHFGREAVFRDIDSIPPGADFRRHIDRVLDESDIILAIVGPRWIGPDKEQLRLASPADPVRLEIETALRKDKPLIPVLVSRAVMPHPDVLPASLQDFVYRNAVQIDSGQDFDVHVGRLIRAIERLLRISEQREADEAVQGAPPLEPTPKAERPAEEERQRAEAAGQAEEERQRAEAARQAEEERQRAEAVRLAEQEGSPIYRLIGFLTRIFAKDQRRAQVLRPAEGRGHFPTRLVKKVLFSTSMLGLEKPPAPRRSRLRRAGAFTLAGIVVLASAALSWHVRDENRQQVAEMDAALTAYRKTANGLPLEPVADADFVRVLPLLDQARALPHGYDHREGNASWLELHLSVDAELAAQARDVYQNALERVFLPRLIWRLEAQMRGAIDQPDFLYEATRVYLMLGATGPLDRDLVRAWMSLDWQATYPGAVMVSRREDLGRHLNALLAGPLPQIRLDAALLAKARATFSRVPIASRVYSRIAPLGAAQAVPPWRPADALGAAGVRIFVRASGKPLTDGIPGFYTIEGFYRVLQPALADATKQVASESWVLGFRSQISLNSAEAQRLEQDVIQLYEHDYAKHWDAMIEDLNLVPLRTPDQAAQDLYILGSPQSPILDLLVSIARQLTLTQPPPAAKTKSAAEAGSQKVAPNAMAPLDLVDRTRWRILGNQGDGLAPKPPGKEIDDRYQELRYFVGSGPGAPIDGALKAIDGLRQKVGKILTSPFEPVLPSSAAQADDPVQLLRAEAARDPQPVSRWLEALAASGEALINGRIRQQVVDAFKSSNGPVSLCQKAVTGRYPFVPGATNDIPLGDFARLFSPGGLLDGFFNTQLQPYVDTSGANWTSRPVNGIPAPIASADLSQFQRAAVIRDLFFPTGGATPVVRFYIFPLSLDEGGCRPGFGWN
jgi:type VI secretion system protein ImpL